MQGFSESGVIAILLGVLLLPLLFIPYVAWSFRRGTTGLGHAAISTAGIFYLMGLWTYTVLPLPEVSTLTCSVHAQWIPLHFVTDIEAHGARILLDPAVRQVVLNVIFFIPLGVLLRHLFGWRVSRCIAAGFVTSLVIEVTQLTGIWWIYPCAYRVFDVDDLIANTAGAVIGVALAPLAARIPGQHRRAADQPAPVRSLRRLTGMAVDFVSVAIIGAGIPLLVRVLLYAGGADYRSHTVAIQVMATGAAALVLLWVVPAATGGTMGHHLTFLRPVRRDGRAPRPLQWAIRFIAGAGGLFVALVLADMGVPGMSTLWVAWAVLSAIAVIALDTRGISGYASGLFIVDARDPSIAHAVQQPGVDPRRMRSAVLATGGLVFALVAVVIALAEMFPVVGLGVATLGLVALLAASLFTVGYLIYNGVVVVRREGRSLSNLLALLSVAGVIGLAVLLAVAVLTGWAWLTVVAVCGLALSAYLGFLFGAFLLYGQLYARRTPDPGVDAVIVLGSRVFGETVPPLLAARIDKGMAIVADEEARGHTPLLVLSGGQGPDEDEAEGAVMARYAVAAGADPAHVRAETASRSTEENLTLSTRLLEAEGRTGPVVVSTNDFHAFRAAVIAQQLGVRAQVVGAPTARYFFPSAVLREFVGVLARSKIGYGTAALAVMAVSGVLAWFAAG